MADPVAVIPLRKEVLLVSGFGTGMGYKIQRDCNSALGCQVGEVIKGTLVISRRGV